MAKVGLLTVSDGRASVHRDVGAFAAEVEGRIAAALENAGHTLVRAAEVVWTNELAVSEARRIADGRPDLTIVNVPVWAFPHFTMRAAGELTGSWDADGGSSGHGWSCSERQWCVSPARAGPDRGCQHRGDQGRFRFRCLLRE